MHGYHNTPSRCTRNRQRTDWLDSTRNGVVFACERGRLKSGFPLAHHQAMFNVIRYVGRNALRANLVDKAQDRRWCSLWRRVLGDRESLLSDWSFDRPANWVEWVNTAQTEGEIEALRKCVNRGTPYGTETWKTKIAATLGLKSTLEPRGRPRKVVGSADTQT
jgi:putative transposase